MSSLNDAVIKKLQKQLTKLSEKEAKLHSKKSELTNKIHEVQYECQVIISKINNLNKEN